MYGSNISKYGEYNLNPLVNKAILTNVYPFLKTGVAVTTGLMHIAKDVANGAGICSIRFVINTDASPDVLALDKTNIATGDVIVKLANATGAKNTTALILALLNGDADVLAKFKTFLFESDPGSTQFGAAEVALNLLPFAGGVIGTQGFFGQVVQDTNGREWSCVVSNSATNLYVWSPEGFPLVSTIYETKMLDENGKRIKKIKLVGNLDNDSTTNINHKIYDYLNQSDLKGYLTSGNNHIKLGNYLSATDCSSAYSNLIQIIITTGTAYYTFPYSAELYFVTN